MIIRQAEPRDARHVAEIHTASWQSAFHGIMSDDFLARQNVEKREAEWLKNIMDYPGNLLIISDSESDIVGFSCSGRVVRQTEHAFDGQVFGIHVSPVSKGRGYGRQLMTASFNWLASLGCKNAFLWTLEANDDARGFYEALGGRIIALKSDNFGDRTLEELAYGWETLTLARRGHSCTTSRDEPLS